MDFEPIAGMAELRKEFDDFFREEMKKAPPGWTDSSDDRSTDEGWAFDRHMAREMGRRGWLALAWPKRYGGLEKNIFEQLAFNEARAYWRAPGWDIQGLGMLGPTVLAAGTEAQKERFLPPLARAEVKWSQAWSEPNAGSDLASLTTRAVLDGDHYVVNGQKVWCSGADHADWVFALVRTSTELKRSRGLTFLLIDLKTPGITIRPLPAMSSRTRKQVVHFCEVFMDNVRVPVENRVGEENRGWAVTRATMNFERSGIANYSEMKRSLHEVIDFCKETRWRGEPLANDPMVRHRLAQVAIDIEVGLASARHLLWGQHRVSIGQKPPPDHVTRASSMKYFYSELVQRNAATMWQILGMYGQLKRESRWAVLAGKFEALVQMSPGLHIGGGTTEIQKNIVAQEGLGLPRI